MAEVGHDPARQGAIRLKQLRTDVQKGHTFRCGQARQELVESRDLHPPWHVGLLLPREDCHEEDVRRRHLGMDAAEDGADTLSDLGGCILAGVARIARVVRADVEHDDARMQAVQLTVIESPEHVLGAVPTETQIQCPVPAQHGLPGLGTAHLICLRLAAPEMRDRVADQHDFRIQPVLEAQDFRVACLPVIGILLQFWDRKDRAIGFARPR